MTTEVDERIRQHYLLEKRLARRILASSRENRTQVAIEAYNELFSNIPWHPLLHTSEEVQKRLAEQRMFFEQLLAPGVDILDIGAGTAYWTHFCQCIQSSKLRISKSSIRLS